MVGTCVCGGGGYNRACLCMWNVLSPPLSTDDYTLEELIQLRDDAGYVCINGAQISHFSPAERKAYPPLTPAEQEKVERLALPVFCDHRKGQPPNLQRHRGGCSTPRCKGTRSAVYKAPRLASYLVPKAGLLQFEESGILPGRLPDHNAATHQVGNVDEAVRAVALFDETLLQALERAKQSGDDNSDAGDDSEEEEDIPIRVTVVAPKGQPATEAATSAARPATFTAAATSAARSGTVAASSADLPATETVSVGPTAAPSAGDMTALQPLMRQMQQAMLAEMRQQMQAMFASLISAGAPPSGAAGTSGIVTAGASSAPVPPTAQPVAAASSAAPV